MDTAESSRVHQEMERFYRKHPEYRVQANHQIFIEAAEQDGGSERLTAEWMELQLDSLRGSLAVLSETPQGQLDKFMLQNPAYDCAANRQLIQDHIRKHYGTVEQAVSALYRQLAFSQDVADEISAQQETIEREELVDLIARNYSLSPHAQAHYRETVLKRATIEELRTMGRNYDLRKHYRAMSDKDLKQEARQDADRRRSALQPSLPSEITAEVIRRASSRQIYDWQIRYGNELLNARLAGRS